LGREESVSDAADGVDDRGLCCVVSKGASQRPDVDVDDAFVGERVVVPHCGEELAAGQYLSRCACQGEANDGAALAVEVNRFC
jgi:hypothetical protein